MTTRDGADGLAILNASGFPFQLRVAAEIQRAKGPLGRWTVEATEFFWRQESSDQSGFVDVMAESGAARLIVECKRGSDATWVFIPRPLESTESEWRVRAFITQRADDEPLALWVDVHLLPPSPEVIFCAVRGQNGKEPMLERLAETLTRSVEAIAREDLLLEPPQWSVGGFWVYVPVLVTTAQLLVARFDPQDVDLQRGKVSGDSATLTSVPAVRLRKQFGPATRRPKARHLRQVQAENEGTLLVVNAQHLETFLQGFDLGINVGPAVENLFAEAVRLGLRRKKA